MRRWKGGDLTIAESTSVHLDGKHLLDARVDQCGRAHVLAVEELAFDGANFCLSHGLCLLKRRCEGHHADGTRASGKQRPRGWIGVYCAKVGEFGPLETREVDDEALL